MWLKIIDEEGWSTFSNCTIIAFAKSSASAGGSLDDRQVSSIHRLKGISRINIIVIAGLIFIGDVVQFTHIISIFPTINIFIIINIFWIVFSQDQLHCHDQPLRPRNGDNQFHRHCRCCWILPIMNIKSVFESWSWSSWLQWLYWEAPILKKIGYKRALLESAKKTVHKVSVRFFLIWASLTAMESSNGRRVSSNSSKS